MVSLTLELPLPLGEVSTTVTLSLGKARELIRNWKQGFPVGEIVGISWKPLTKWSCDIKLRDDGLI